MLLTLAILILITVVSFHFISEVGRMRQSQQASAEIMQGDSQAIPYGRFGSLNGAADSASGVRFEPVGGGVIGTAAIVRSFRLSRSADAAFSLQRMVAKLDLGREQTFFEITLGANLEGQHIVRFGKRKAQHLFAVEGKERVIVNERAISITLPLKITMLGGAFKVTHGDEALFSIERQPEPHAELRVATNLTDSEIQLVDVEGQVGEEQFAIKLLR